MTCDSGTHNWSLQMIVLIFSLQLILPNVLPGNTIEQVTIANKFQSTNNGNVNADHLLIQLT